jgi:hypothetical protein
MTILRACFAALIASGFASTGALAQAPCQPTIMQPCTSQPPPDKTADQSKSSASKKANQPAGAADGVRLSPDTGFGVDKGGNLGPQRQLKAGIALPF